MSRIGGPAGVAVVKRNFPCTRARVESYLQPLQPLQAAAHRQSLIEPGPPLFRELVRNAGFDPSENTSEIRAHSARGYLKATGLGLSGVVS